MLHIGSRGSGVGDNFYMIPLDFVWREKKALAQVVLASTAVDVAAVEHTNRTFSG